jgi:hypothetical protein
MYFCLNLASPRYKANVNKNNNSSVESDIIANKNDEDNKLEGRKSNRKLIKNLSFLRLKNRRFSLIIETSDENFMKYAFMNPFSQKEKKVEVEVSEDNLKYLRKISSLPHLGFEDKKKKTVKFIDQPQGRKISTNQQFGSVNSSNKEEELKRKG